MGRELLSKILQGPELDLADFSPTLVWADWEGPSCLAPLPHFGDLLII